MSAQIIPFRRPEAAFDVRQGPAGAEKPSILELIQQIADDLGIDVEAPFRPKTKGGKN
jgi:hypothetical protein